MKPEYSNAINRGIDVIFHWRERLLCSFTDCNTLEQGVCLMRKNDRKAERERTKERKRMNEGKREKEGDKERNRE
jgi:hypothetical protein